MYPELASLAESEYNSDGEVQQVLSVEPCRMHDCISVEIWTRGKTFVWVEAREYGTCTMGRWSQTCNGRRWRWPGEASATPD